MAGQPRRARRREPDEIRVVRNIGNDLRARARERRAERRAKHAARLHDERPRFAPGAQVFGNGQIRLQLRINQRIFQQDGMRLDGQFTDGFGSIGEPVRKTVGGRNG